MAIRFLITKEEEQKREFKSEVRDLITKYKYKVKDLVDKCKVLDDKNTELEVKLKNTDIEFLKAKITEERERSSKMLDQVNHYEDEIKKYEVKVLKQIEMIGENSNKLIEEKLTKERDKKRFKSENAKLENDNKKIMKRLKEASVASSKQARTIKDLRDIITHRESQLKARL